MPRYQRSETTGRWPSILAGIGIESKFLKKANGPCPLCGGRDRFRFLDTDGAGTWICNQCGTGDGMHLVQRFREVDFIRASKLVQEQLPQAVVTAQPGPIDAKQRLRALWKQSHPVVHGDAVHRYLEGRGVWSVPPSKDLRTLPSTKYFDQGKCTGSYPAMLALVRDGEGRPTTLHVTYLTEVGTKADVPSQKKVMSTMGVGAHIELFQTGAGDLCIAEGIETALAVRKMYGGAVYAMISAGGMKGFVMPEFRKRVVIFGDNDENYTGQAAAYALAQRLSTEGVDVDVRIPEQTGTDWAD